MSRTGSKRTKISPYFIEKPVKTTKFSFLWKNLAKSLDNVSKRDYNVITIKRNDKTATPKGTIRRKTK